MMRTPTLELRSATASATTFSFLTTGEGFRSWALCTVNDRTGELLITSDWGNWSYRWDASPSALGAPTLTAFLGDRGCVDYLARKLQGRRGGQRFSAELTVAAWRRTLCERRLEDRRCQLDGRIDAEALRRLDPELRERFDADGFPLFRFGSTPYLTRDLAREIWDALDEAAADCGDSVDLFLDRVHAIDGFTEHVDERPFESLESVQTAEDRALRETILPALIAACRDAHRAQTMRAWFTPGPQPVETAS